MFGIGLSEFIVIIIVAIIFIGPDKLPQMARTLGKALAEFKRAGEEIKKSFNEPDKAPEKPGKEGPGDAGRPGGLP